MGKMKIFRIKFLNCLLVIVTLLVYQGYASQREKEVQAFNKKNREEKRAWEKESIRLSGGLRKAMYRDGEYEGEGKGFGGPISVKVVISNDEIQSVKIIAAKDETPEYVEMMDSLTEEIIAGQSTDVDVISGATFSSKGVLEAVNNALSKAGKK